MTLLDDRVLDLGLTSLVAEGTRFDLCSSQPANYAALAGVTLGNGTPTFGSIVAGSPNGRRVSLSASGTITTGGVATCWTVSDPANSRLLESGPLVASHVVVAGHGFTIPSFVVLELPATAVTGVVASGGTETTSGDYKIHTFTSSGNFIVASPGEVEYFILGGGGGGGGSATGLGGGGGSGGEVKAGVGFAVTPQTYPIVVGGGGAGNVYTAQAASGVASTALGLTAVGGGFGGSSNVGFRNGGAGAHGGGGASAGTGTAGTVSRTGGNGASWVGGGGGGGGSNGGNAVSTTSAGNGGTGTTSSISGASVDYGGGGGGGAISTATRGAASHGGGMGGDDGAGVAGTVNRGGGGGGGGNATGGAGGSGIVIIRYII